MDPMWFLREKHRATRAVVRWFGVGLALLGLLIGSHANALEYTVQQGDTFQQLAKRFYGDARQWQKIARANGGQLRPGVTILIPEEGDPAHPAGKIVRSWGKVEFVTPEMESFVHMRMGAGLLWQHTMRTAPDARAEIELLDGSRLLVGNGTELTMLGVVDKGKGKKPLRIRMELIQGKIELLSRAGSRVDLEVLTDESFWLLRGGDIAFMRDKNEARVGVLEGEVIHKQVSISQGEAGVYNLAGDKKHESELPAQVQIPWGSTPNLPILLALGDDARTALHWNPLAEAHRYEVELYRRNRLVTRQIVPQPNTVVALERVGLYEVRLRAWNAQGLPGAWSRARVFGLKVLPSRAPVRANAEGMMFTGAVAMTFQEVPPDMSLFVVVDDALPQKVRNGQSFELGGIGDHKMRLNAVLPDKNTKEGVREIDAAFDVRIEAIPNINIKFSPHQLDPLAKPKSVKIEIELRDSQNQPIRGEEPLVKAGRRSCQALEEKPGLYTCTLRPRVAPGLDSLPLVIEGRGGSFREERAFQIKQINAESIKVFE